MARPHPETISPTAHYTGYVWFAHGHSHEAFATTTGRVMYHALRAPNLVAERAKLPTLEGMLLARHRLIDLRLAVAIETGLIGQVVEIAAGLSPRGWRFAKRYGDRITYIEATDLELAIDSTQELERAVGVAHDAIAGAKPALAIALDELCRRQLGALEIAVRDAGATDPELARLDPQVDVRQRLPQ